MGRNLLGWSANGPVMIMISAAKTASMNDTNCNRPHYYTLVNIVRNRKELDVGLE